MSRFIRKTFQVADPEAVMVHSQGASPKATFYPDQTNIFLIGLRASGKTTLARLLAQRLGMRFVDTDELIIDRAGMSITDIVRNDGWEAFRRLETEILRQVCDHRGQVVATGGGIVLAPENRELISRSGTTFFLMAETPTLLARLKAAPQGEHRPPLSDQSPEQELIQSSMQRGPIYITLANHILRTEGSLESTLNDALKKLGVT